MKTRNYKTINSGLDDYSMVLEDEERDRVEHKRRMREQMEFFAYDFYEEESP